MALPGSKLRNITNQQTDKALTQKFWKLEPKSQHHKVMIPIRQLHYSQFPEIMTVNSMLPAAIKHNHLSKAGIHLATAYSKNILIQITKRRATCKLHLLFARNANHHHHPPPTPGIISNCLHSFPIIS